MTLKTDYKDDVLDTSVNTKRKYRMIQNDDGTVSFEDVTEYIQEGDSYGASEINMYNSIANASLQVVSFEPVTGELVTTSEIAINGNGVKY